MTIFDNLSDLRAQIEALKPEAFVWFALRQADRTKTCACVDDPNLEGKCKRCLGTKHPFTDHLVKGYLWKRTPGVEYYTSAGRISTGLRNIVFEHDYPVQKFDQILELAMDPETGTPRQPFQIVRTYVLSDIMPLRGRGGRVEFWKGEVEERTLTDDKRGEGGTGYEHISNR